MNPETALPLLLAAFPEARIELLPNPDPNAAPSLRVDPRDALRVATLLRDHPELAFDFASNVSGVDWPLRTVKKTVVRKELVEGVEKEIKETVEETQGGYLEAVYHLFSVTKRHGPLVLRMRTENRDAEVTLPSLTPVWKSADFQEREIFDLYGIRFEGHPDLRRLLMWDAFTDHPMRKDYVAPDDCEYEPTPHDDILVRVQARAAAGAEVVP